VSYAKRAAQADTTKEEVDGTAKGFLESAQAICKDVVASNRTEVSCKIDTSSNQGIVNSANTIQYACENAANSKTGWEDEKKSLATRIAVPLTTTLVAGGLGAGITASVIQAKKENIKNEAAQKWMDEVGEHIQCYIGTDELGSYGDVVSIELD
jgi:hypothetical protein